MPLIVAGKQIAAPLAVVDFLQDPTTAMARPWNTRPRRGERPVGIVLHAQHAPADGKRQRVHDRQAAATELTARALIAEWRRRRAFVGGHLVLDGDGSAYCCADLAEEAAFHAPGCNGSTVGLFVSTARDASVFAAQLVALPLLVGAVSDALDIPRRVAYPYRGRARVGIAGEAGVWGYRDCAEDRPGDPGDLLVGALAAAGWEKF